MNYSTLPAETVWPDIFNEKKKKEKKKNRKIEKSRKEKWGKNDDEGKNYNLKASR